MKAVKNTLASTVAALCIPMGMALTSTAAQAEVTGNAGITSDYLWRGVTQTNHASAVSGGIDYGHTSGVYVGTWVSNFEAGPSDNNGTEIDLYGGFAGETAGLSYDIGYLMYNYPGLTDLDFAEVYLTLGYSIASVSYFNDMDNENSYVALDLGTEVMGVSVGATYGMAMMKDSAGDYAHYGVSISKGMGDDWDATFGLSATDMDDDVPVATISMSKSFSLIK